ncbi:unnamed protein product [Nippostrongylus brasiliensis]|uniref:Skp1 domain-containing protein n=1 Tax=Nippostrongylus brasiliensis TaxID=27835 RepID=A0A158QX76_NIPBR|nr:unnamed protein product [Nippostrongylus brasiliensis]
MKNPLHPTCDTLKIQLFGDRNELNTQVFPATTGAALLERAIGRHPAPGARDYEQPSPNNTRIGKSLERCTSDHAQSPRGDRGDNGRVLPYEGIFAIPLAGLINCYCRLFVLSFSALPPSTARSSSSASSSAHMAAAGSASRWDGLVADYFECPTLIRRVLATINDKLVGESPSDICEAFNILSDRTAEQRSQMEHEDVWNFNC